jgi:hypothetical protein
MVILLSDKIYPTNAFVYVTGVIKRKIMIDFERDKLFIKTFDEDKNKYQLSERKLTKVQFDEMCEMLSMENQLKYWTTPVKKLTQYRCYIDEINVECKVFFKDYKFFQEELIILYKESPFYQLYLFLCKLDIIILSIAP